jgi:hypothetical protein
VVTSPDNSFLPGGAAARAHTTIRSVPAALTSDGRSVIFATAGVVVGIYAQEAQLAAAAAQTVVPINEPSSPGEPLPPALPDTGFAETPLPAQLPALLAPPVARPAAGAPRSSCASPRTCDRRRR